MDWDLLFIFVLEGRTVKGFFKGFDKITRVGVADVFGDISNTHLRGAKKIGCNGETMSRNKFPNGHVVIVLKPGL